MEKKLVIEHIGKNTCKYHREPGQIYSINHFGPRGLCLDLYHSAYPYFLALSEGAEFSWMKKTDRNAVYGQCPAPDGNVHFEVRRSQLKKEIIHHGIRKLQEIILTITDIEKRKEINDCICHHIVGEKFEFNQGDLLEQMCPAAFNNMYPILKAILSGGKTSWVKNGHIYTQCPDNITKIGFEIKCD